MKSSASTQHNILLITLDHGPWETYLENNLWTNLSQVNKVYYESEDPSTLDKNVKGFTEDGVLQLIQLTTSILAFVQVPELKKHYDIFAMAHGNDEAKNFTIPRIAYIKFFLDTLYHIHTLEKKFEEYQEQYKGDVCMFDQIIRTTYLLDDKLYNENMDHFNNPRIKLVQEEIERFYNELQRILYTFSNNYLKWFRSFESKTFFNMEEYTKRLDQIFPSDDKHKRFEKYKHAMFYVISMRDRMLFQLKLKKEFVSPGNYIAMIGDAHLESLKKMFEEDETKWNIKVFDYRKFGINEQIQQSYLIEKFKIQEAFANLEQLLSFESKPVTNPFDLI